MQAQIQRAWRQKCRIGSPLGGRQPQREGAALAGQGAVEGQPASHPARLLAADAEAEARPRNMASGWVLGPGDALDEPDALAGRDALHLASDLHARLPTALDG